VHAQQVLLGAVPLPHAASMYPRAPVAVLLPVTLTAQPVRFLERDGLPAGEVQLIPIVGVVAIETPPVLGVVLQVDVRVHVGQRSPLSIRGHVFVVAGAAGENAVGKRRRRHLHACARRRRLRPERPQRHLSGRRRRLRAGARDQRDERRQAERASNSDRGATHGPDS